MSDLKEVIRLHLRDEIENKRMINIAELAAKLQAQFPHMDLHELGEEIFEAVILAGGNAHWGPRAPPEQEGR